MFDGWFGDQDVDAALYCVQGDGIVSAVRGEYCDSVAGGESVDGCFVGVWVPRCGV